MITLLLKFERFIYVKCLQLIHKYKYRESRLIKLGLHESVIKQQSIKYYIEAIEARKARQDRALDRIEHEAV